ncbi:MAG: ester cyclase [Chloroflexi bacterium]|nr:ester cyclase [Chloroflexota bacterium]
MVRHAVRSAFFCALLILTLMPLVVSAQSENPLPAPTGPYDVGVVWRHWVDESRDEPYVHDTDDKREVIVQFLYPAVVEAGAVPQPYFDNADLFMPVFTGLLAPAVNLTMQTQAGDLSVFQSHAYPDAPLSDALEQYPVLIFSHGGGADVRMYTAQIEEMASHGYVVAAINHVYGASYTTLLDGRPAIPTYEGGFEPAANHWSADQIFVMDQLERLNENDPDGVFTGRLDLDRLGVFGQSLGGTTTTITCFVDPRCKAGAAGDGPVYGGVIEQGLDQPFMYLLSEDRLFSDPAFYGESRGPHFDVAVEGYEHLDYGDFTLWPNIETVIEARWLGGVDGQRAVEITRAALVAFFDTYVKGDPAASMDVLGQYPEVTVSARNVDGMSEAADPSGLTAELAEEFVGRFDAVINEDTALARELFHEDFEAHLPFAQQMDREGWIAYADMFKASFPDIVQTTNFMFHQGDKLVIHVTYHATFSGVPFFGAEPNGQPIVMNGIGIFRYEDGKPIENSAVLDVGELFVQIGLVTPPGP